MVYCHHFLVRIIPATQRTRAAPMTDKIQPCQALPERENGSPAPDQPVDESTHEGDGNHWRLPSRSRRRPTARAEWPLTQHRMIGIDEA
jgi:hypothetical protein